LKRTAIFESAATGKMMCIRSLGMNNRIDINARDRVFLRSFNGISPLGIASRFHQQLAKLVLVYLKADE
jgi:hypothetical protein